MPDCGKAPGLGGKFSEYVIDPGGGGNGSDLAQVRGPGKNSESFPGEVVHCQDGNESDSINCSALIETDFSPLPRPSSKVLQTVGAAAVNHPITLCYYILSLIIYGIGKCIFYYTSFPCARREKRSHYPSLRSFA